MTQLIKQLETADDSSVDTLQAAVKGWITQNEIGFGKIMMPLRVALVGALEGVDVFDIIYLIGKSETITTDSIPHRPSLINLNIVW